MKDLKLDNLDTIDPMGKYALVGAHPRYGVYAQGPISLINDWDWC